MLLHVGQIVWLSTKEWSDQGPRAPRWSIILALLQTPLLTHQEQELKLSWAWELTVVLPVTQQLQITSLLDCTALSWPQKTGVFTNYRYEALSQICCSVVSPYTLHQSFHQILPSVPAKSGILHSQIFNFSDWSQGRHCWLHQNPNWECWVMTGSSDDFQQSREIYSWWRRCSEMQREMVKRGTTPSPSLQVLPYQAISLSKCSCLKSQDWLNVQLSWSKPFHSVGSLFLWSLMDASVSSRQWKFGVWCLGQILGWRCQFLVFSLDTR